MDNHLLQELEHLFKKCSDYMLDPDYILLLNKLYDVELSQELVSYLCEKSILKKFAWERRLDHLRILLINPSAKMYDLKAFYYENIKKSRRLALKLFYIRGYAIYASEEELTPVMDKFCNNLGNNHDYIDYRHIMSAAGLPYLVNTYEYACFVKALKKAEEEYQKIDPLLKGYFTLNSDLEYVSLLSSDECKRRTYAFLEKCRPSH